MKTIQLGSIRIENFKGIKSFETEFNDGLTTIYGDNATGKTTTFDAVTWLLFGKDSLDSTKFDILPIGSTGLSASVEATILVDRSITTLKKTYKEKYTKKRNRVSAKRELTGHDIDHFVDGVPVKKNEYDAAIRAICDEEPFRLLTIPLYFNEVLHWQKRREILFNVCGDLTDEQVISSSLELAGLPEILGSHTMDDHIKIVKARRTEVNKQLADVPVKITEAERAKAPVTESRESLQKTIATLMKQDDELNAEIKRLQEGGQAAELKRLIAELDSRIIQIQNRDAIELQKQWAVVNQRNEKIQRQIFELKADKNSFISNSAIFERDKADLEKRISALRSEYLELEKQQYAGDTNCPTCGQALPEDQIKNAVEKFNLTQSQEKERIKLDGKVLKRQLAELPPPAEFTGQAELDQLEATPPEKVSQPAVSPEIKKLQSDKNLLEYDLSKLGSNTETASKISELKAKIAGIETEISACRNSLAQIETNARQDKRIVELKAEEKMLAREFEKIESELALCELFVRTKVDLVTDSINAKFKFVKFQLFEEQINGGIKEVCNVTLRNGSPELSHSEKINAGVDIINVFSEFHGVNIFQFIDNAEAVTDLLPTEAQRIRLVVSEADKTLRIGE